MKKIIALMMVTVLALTCALSLTSCFDKTDDALVGTYEMTSISGSITSGGVTTELTTDLYDYYKITLEKSGKAIIESRGAGTSLEYKDEGTWEYDNGELKITSETQGVKVTEVMQWKDDVITYNATQNASGMVINMKLVLEKVTD